MLSIEQIYVLGFLALSGAIGLTSWPHRRPGEGLICGFIALLLSIGLGWQVAIVSGSWFALGQRLDYLISELQTQHSLLYMPLQGIALMLHTLTDFLALSAYMAFPGLPINLGVCLVFLALYLVFKTTMLLLGWLIYWLGSGLALIYKRTNGVERHYPKVNNKSPALAGATGFPQIITTGLLLILTPLLTALPYLTAAYPTLTFPFNTLFWPGAWIILLELHLWLRRGDGRYARGCQPHIARRCEADTQNWFERLRRQPNANSIKPLAVNRDEQTMSRQ